MKYRQLVWEYLSELVSIERYKERVLKVLLTYGGRIEDVSIPVAEFDLQYIISIFNINFSATELSNCIAADKLVKIFNGISISCEMAFEKYFDGKRFHIYQLLYGKENLELDHIQLMNHKKIEIEKYIAASNIEEFKLLIDVCSDVERDYPQLYWEVGNGLRIALENISEKGKTYIEVIEYYIQKNTPYNLNPCRIINNLFTTMSAAELFEFVNLCQYNQKNTWIYAYYHEIPKDYISTVHVRGLYSFLELGTDQYNATYRDVAFLEKFAFLDQNVFINGCKIIVAKIQYSTSIVKSYFEPMFLENHTAIECVLQKFDGNIDLLEEIYLALLKCSTHHDHDGKYLSQIYILSPSILDKYINYMIHSDSASFHYDCERVLPFFENKDFILIFDRIVDQFLDNCSSSSLKVPGLLEQLIIPRKNEAYCSVKQDEWIRHGILENAKNPSKMRVLFSAIAKMPNGKKIEYMQLFLESNGSFEDFKKLPLTPLSWGWTGSEIPIYNAWIDYLREFLPCFIGLKWIKHKEYIEANIAHLVKQKESAEIEELLRG